MPRAGRRPWPSEAIQSAISIPVEAEPALLLTWPSWPSIPSRTLPGAGPPLVPFSLRPAFPPLRGTLRVTSATGPASERQRASELTSDREQLPATPSNGCGPAAAGPRSPGSCQADPVWPWGRRSHVSTLARAVSTPIAPMVRFAPSKSVPAGSRAVSRALVPRRARAVSTPSAQEVSFAPSESVPRGSP